LAALSAYGQALPPHSDPQEVDSCGRASTIVNETVNGTTYTYETFITSAVKLDPDAKLGTLPLFKGYEGSGTANPVYYIMTDTSDCTEARTRGLNYVPKLGLLINPTTGAPLNAAVQQVTVDTHGVHFAGWADFSPVRQFEPGPLSAPWFPTLSVPGSVDELTEMSPPAPVPTTPYTPFITYKNAAGKYVVFNASQVANSTGIKDFVPFIDYTNMNVTFNLVQGIYDFDFVMYLRMDASDPIISGFEGGIYAPAPAMAQGNGLREFGAPDFSARQTIIPVLNGFTGTDQIYNRQGLYSAALGEGDPYNVMGAAPGEDDYSPIWDITPVQWTPLAISLGVRQRLHQDDEVGAFLHAKWLTSVLGPDGMTPFFSGAVNKEVDTTGLTPVVGITSANIVSNCPIMIRIKHGLPTYKGGQ
jgi:hypothetical protein